MIWVGSLRQDTPVELKPGDFAIDEARGRGQHANCGAARSFRLGLGFAARLRQIFDVGSRHLVLKRHRWLRAI